jgi:hypothetical protein
LVRNTRKKIELEMQRANYSNQLSSPKRLVGIISLFLQETTKEKGRVGKMLETDLSFLI